MKRNTRFVPDLKRVSRDLGQPVKTCDQLLAVIAQMERLEGKVTSPPIPVGVGAQAKQILAKLCATWICQSGFPFSD